ncbi:uncharacterized protein LOC130713213 [Lotus japonicus]|uniref:uncharacterized protein LOC130713213 n=1 Tax=Lotus japonicus TaxID=34305 RepID=UPI00258F15AB|nr:uncharacterized protein LOC130713213 [Lotus japonicus]
MVGPDDSQHLAIQDSSTQEVLLREQSSMINDDLNVNDSLRKIGAHVHALVGVYAWTCSAVYASPTVVNRDSLWDHLSILRTQITKPWLAVGDFNEILYPSEVRGGAFLPGRALRFASVLDNCDLLDLEAKGGLFTWHRKERGILRISKKLDRALADSEWRLSFPEAFVEVQTRMHSDHNPILVRFNAPEERTRDRPFRYLAAWSNHDEYRSVVSNAWRGSGGNLHEKIHRVQTDSMSFNKHTFGNVFQRKRHVEGRLRGVQRDLDTRVTSSMVQLEEQLQLEYRGILRNEELLWFQKSGNNGSGLVIATQLSSTLKPLSVGSAIKSIGCNWEMVENLPTIPHDCTKDLLEPVSKAEVKRALMSMKSFKAPGPDGFQPVFFKKYWDIVGEDIWRVVRDAFVTGSIDPALAETLIVLIPKVDVPTQMKDLRPISLCNVVYKIITKVLVSRIRPYLDQIIGPLQSSFIPGRGTTDNAILAQEVIHYLAHSMAKKGSMAFKIDLEKAYDKLSWEFLEGTIKDFGFPEVTCHLIMNCVTSSKLDLLWNGSKLPWFNPVRGLRQGDPMSPYLFVMCMEKLSVRIQNAVSAGLWHPITMSRGGPPLSHILFADDVLLFCKAKSSQVEVVASILADFGSAPGLIVSAAKSKALCSKGVPAATRHEIALACLIRVVRSLGKYLGFPMPRQDGGIGVRDTSFANTSLLGKLVWTLLQDPEKLWARVLSHKYLGSKSILDVVASSSTSSLWKGIPRARDVLKEGFRFKLGNGTTSIWYHNWSGQGSLATRLPFVHITDTSLSLRDVIRDGSWNFSGLYTIIPPDLQQSFHAIVPSLDARLVDCWTWKHDRNGVYTAASAYSWLISEAAQPSVPPLVPWKFIWKIEAPEKIRVFVWLLMHDVIQVNNFRFRCHLVSSPACTRCNHHVEDSIHCLRDCRFAREVWSRLDALSWPGFLSGDILSWFLCQARGTHASLFATAIWGIWRWRNNALLGDNSWSAMSTVQRILHDHHEHITYLSSDLLSLTGSVAVARWSVPPAGRLKLNTDGAFDHVGTRSGMGGLVRDASGYWVCGFYAGATSANPLLAEIEALKLGLNMLWDANLRCVDCEVDCLDIVQALANNTYQFHVQASNLLELKLLLDRDWDVELRHISRDANDAADCLAGLGSRLQCSYTYLEVPPHELCPILARDLLAL